MIHLRSSVMTDLQLLAMRITDSVSGVCFNSTTTFTAFPPFRLRLRLELHDRWVALRHRAANVIWIVCERNAYLSLYAQILILFQVVFNYFWRLVQILFGLFASCSAGMEENDRIDRENSGQSLWEGYNTSFIVEMSKLHPGSSSANHCCSNAHIPILCGFQLNWGLGLILFRQRQKFVQRRFRRESLWAFQATGIGRRGRK